jgi:hypothetical protein
MRIQAFALGLALAWAAIGVARASDVEFTISGGGQTATFELDSTSGYGVNGVFVFFPSVPVTFWNEGLGGGFVTNGFVFSEARQFYSGSESNPVFLPGSYKVSDSNGSIDTVTVKELSDPPIIVSDPPPVIVPPDPPVIAVPELSTWAMLLLGFLSLGYAGYRKTRTRTIN